MSVWERVYKINSVNSEGERERKREKGSREREREGEREKERKDYQHLQQHSSPRGIVWTFEPWWQAVAAMHRACSCLVMCVRVCVSRKAHRQRGEERRVKENEEEVEVINISLASSQTSSRYLNVTKSIHQWTQRRINLLADILMDRYSRWLSESPKKLCDRWALCDRTANHSHDSGPSADRSQVGQARGQRSKVQYVGRQHDHRPTNLRGGHLCRPKILSRCCGDTLG